MKRTRTPEEWQAYWDEEDRKSKAREARERSKQEREGLISQIAESRIGDLDAATIFEIVGNEGTDLDAAIEACERKERKRLAKIPTEKLWEIVENL